MLQDIDQYTKKSQFIFRLFIASVQKYTQKYTCDEQSKDKIKNIIPLMTASKRIKIQEEI